MTIPERLAELKEPAAEGVLVDADSNEQEEAGDLPASVIAGPCWECPCSDGPLTRDEVTFLRRLGVFATPERTTNAAFEPFCRFCGRAFRDEWRVSDEAGR